MPTQDTLKQMVQHCGKETLSIAAHGLPRVISLSSACSGSGCFELCARALCAELDTRYAVKANGEISNGWEAR